MSAIPMIPITNEEPSEQTLDELRGVLASLEEQRAQIIGNANDGTISDSEAATLPPLVAKIVATRQQIAALEEREREEAERVAALERQRNESDLAQTKISCRLARERFLEHLGLASSHLTDYRHELEKVGNLMNAVGRAAVFGTPTHHLRDYERLLLEGDEQRIADQILPRRG